MVTCSRASCLLSLVIFWAVLTLFHFSAPGRTSLTSFLANQPGSHNFDLLTADEWQDDSSAHSTLIRRSLLTAFKAAPTAPKPPCPSLSPPPDQLERLYTFTARVEDREDSGAGVSVSIALACSLPSTVVAPRAYFRLRTTGPTMTALPPTTVMETGQGRWSGYVRVPDAGSGYHLHVKLMLWNASDDVMTKDYVLNYKVEESEVFSVWVDQPILNSPFNFSIGSSAYPQHVPPPYSGLTQPLSSSQSSLPLCFTPSIPNATLAGRWQLGEPHTHIERQWWSDSPFDDYYAMWSPFDCRIDYTLSLLDQMRTLKWINVVGDSNMRALFTRLCEVGKGTPYHGEPTLGYMDLPKLCVLDGGNAVITYSSWFMAKKLPLHPYLSFHEQCAKYSESLDQIRKDDTIFGWPNCSLAAASIHSLARPSFLYLGWGSHVAEWGASAHTLDYFSNDLMQRPYFKLVPTLFALTEDVDVTMIPTKFGKQYVYRNNQRIHAVNQLLQRAVTTHYNNRTWPTHTVDGEGREVAGFVPIFDVFSATHAASEVLHGDAVHFWGEFEIEIVKWLTHWLHYAPQLNLQGKYKQVKVG